MTPRQKVSYAWDLVLDGLLYLVIGGIVMFVLAALGYAVGVIK